MILITLRDKVGNIVYFSYLNKLHKKTKTINEVIYEQILPVYPQPNICYSSDTDPLQYTFTGSPNLYQSVVQNSC